MILCRAVGLSEKVEKEKDGHLVVGVDVDELSVGDGTDELRSVAAVMASVVTCALLVMSVADIELGVALEVHGLLLATDVVNFG